MKGVLTTLLPNSDSDQDQNGYLPDNYYEFEFEAQQQVNGILIAILVEGDLKVIHDMLPVPFENMYEESYVRGVLQQLHNKLDEIVQIGSSIRWSGVKAEYVIN